MKELKNVRRGRIAEYAEQFTVQYIDSQRPWGVQCDVALPCATQNEINGERRQDTRAATAASASAKARTCRRTPEAVDVFLEHKILFGPGKAANAGGVSVSGLEMSQNSMRLQWSQQRSGQAAAAKS